jgi:hypothetical protein
MERLTEAGRQIAAFVIDARGQIQGYQTNKDLNNVHLVALDIAAHERVRIFSAPGQSGLWWISCGRAKGLAISVARKKYVRLKLYLLSSL